MLLKVPNEIKYIILKYVNDDIKKKYDICMIQLLFYSFITNKIIKKHNMNYLYYSYILLNSIKKMNIKCINKKMFYLIKFFNLNTDNPDADIIQRFRDENKAINELKYITDNVILKYGYEKIIKNFKHVIILRKYYIAKPVIKEIYKIKEILEVV
jgi:hypothetical protein